MKNEGIVVVEHHKEDIIPHSLRTLISKGLNIMEILMSPFCKLYRLSMKCVCSQQTQRKR